MSCQYKKQPGSLYKISLIFSSCISSSVSYPLPSTQFLFQTLDRVSTTLACDSAIWGLAFRSYSYTPFFSSGNISDSSLSSLFHVFSPFFSISFHFFPLILKSESSDCSFCFVGLFVTCFRLVCDQFDWELSHHWMLSIFGVWVSSHLGFLL